MGTDKAKERNEVIERFINNIIADVEEVYKKHGGETTESNSYVIEREVRNIEHHYSSLAYGGYNITIR